MFTAVSRNNVDALAVLLPLRITPSVAEQEGQQTETEATGAPQKHHYTLNQQVGSITRTPRADAFFQRVVYG